MPPVWSTLVTIGALGLGNTVALESAGKAARYGE
jgi:hypothetical protein